MDTDRVSEELVRIAGLLAGGRVASQGESWVSTHGFDRVFEALESVDWNDLARSNRSLMKRLNKLEVEALRETHAYEMAIVDGYSDGEALDEAADRSGDVAANLRYGFYKKNIGRMKFDSRLAREIERYL
jgi:hypothetical protein